MKLALVGCLYRRSKLNESGLENPPEESRSPFWQHSCFKHIVSYPTIESSLHHFINSYQFNGFSFDEMCDDIKLMWEAMENQKKQYLP